MVSTRVYLEEGTTSVFAVALDWPGWCRRAKTPDMAIEALDAYRSRYEMIAGNGFAPERLNIIGTLRGDATTDFGAPSQRGPWDDEPLSSRELDRQLVVLEKCWTYFDEVIAGAPALLRKGPRGGGRDRDKIVDHVREAERHYCPKAGVRVAPRTPWVEQRAALVTALRGDFHGAWPKRYAITRLAWHVVDHAWEVEDKSD